MAPDLELVEEVWKQKPKVPQTVPVVAATWTAGGGGRCCLGGPRSPPERREWGPSGKGTEKTLAFDPHNNSMSEVLFLIPFPGRETEAHRSWALARVHKPSRRKNPCNPASWSASVNIYSLASQNIKNLVFDFVVKLGWQPCTETLPRGSLL